MRGRYLFSRHFEGVPVESIVSREKFLFRRVMKSAMSVNGEICVISLGSLGSRDVSFVGGILSVILNLESFPRCAGNWLNF